MFRLAIAEDQQDSIEQLQSYIQRYGQENDETFDISIFKNGMELVHNYQPIYDLLLLDIDMPLLDGMSAAEQIREVDEQVLLMFITNMAQYAVKSYEVNASDYLLKPLNYYAFALKMKRLLRKLRDRSERKLILKNTSEMRRLTVSDIIYIEVANHQLIYHTKNGNFSLSGSLRAAEDQLMGEPFARCNNCYLVNLAYVDGVKQDYITVQGIQLKMSRNKRKAFLQSVLQYHRGWTM